MKWYRITVILSMSIRFFLQIYWFQRKWQNGDISNLQQAWEQLLAAQGREFYKRALQLEGLMIKVGQYLSTRVDILPRSFTNELKDLVDRVPPANHIAIRKQLERVWNVPLSQIFHEFPKEPIASASIADVYRATLVDGTVVAVKIRRPNVAPLIRSDFTALRLVVSLVKRFTKWSDWLDLDALYQDFVTTTTRELNFRTEQEHGKRFTAMIERHQLKVVTPHYYEQYTSEQTLVMQWLDGVSIANQGWLSKHNINRQQLVQEMIDLFFAQIFDEGFFHADPHPGNLLIDSNGTLQVIDFGMMGVIADSHKRNLRMFLQGFIAQDMEKMASAFQRLGFLRSGATPEELQTLLKTGLDFFLNKDFSKVDEQLMVELLQFLREYIANNPLQLPADFSFLGRAISMMSGVLADLDPNIDYLEVVKPAVGKWLQSKEEEEESSESSGGILHFFRAQLLPWVTQIAQLPQKAEDWFNQQPKADYYRRQQLFSLILTIVLLVGASLFYVFDEWMIAGIAGLATGWQFVIYRKQQRAWRQLIFHQKERASND
jgi:predicted unusual protein kinase regulating ubiquinone biosynthesis (AarF/ABC1/UbiB family)